jgi:hypothetical protein
MKVLLTMQHCVAQSVDLVAIIDNRIFQALVPGVSATNSWEVVSYEHSNAQWNGKLQRLLLTL